MPELVVELSRSLVAVAPGASTTLEVTVTNVGSTVARIAFAVLGAVPRQIAGIAPATIVLYPAASGTVVLTFTAPGGAAIPAGQFAFGVMAYPVDAPQQSAVAEGRLQIEPVPSLVSSLLPVHSSGRWSGRHIVQLTNDGNTALFVELVPYDMDAMLGFYASPARLALPPGQSKSARLAVRTRKPYLRGPRRSLPFRVFAETERGDTAGDPAGAPRAGDRSRPVVDGVFVQKPILSAAFLIAMAVLLIAVVGGGAWALTRPVAGNNTLDPLGAPPPPTTFTVAATGPQDILVGWSRVAQVGGYRIYPVDAIDRHTQLDPRDVSGDQDATYFRQLQPDTVYCYQMRSLRSATLISPLTKVKCARTKALPISPPVSTPPASSPITTPPVTTPPVTTPPATTPPPGGDPTTPVQLPDQSWVVLANYWKTSRGLAEPLRRAAELSAAHLPAAILRSGDYRDVHPRGKPLVGSYYLIVAGPYRTEASAHGDCGLFHAVPGAIQDCLVRQLHLA